MTDASESDRKPATRFETGTRFGGWVGLTDEALLLARDDECVRVALDDVAQVTVEEYDYFLAVLSAILVGFGLWYARQHPTALLFSLAGLASGYRVYRHRGEVTVHVRDRPRPIRFHPRDLDGFLTAVESSGEAEFHGGPA